MQPLRAYLQLRQRCRLPFPVCFLTGPLTPAVPTRQLGDMLLIVFEYSSFLFELVNAIGRSCKEPRITWVRHYTYGHGRVAHASVVFWLPLFESWIKESFWVVTTCWWRSPSWGLRFRLSTSSRALRTLLSPLITKVLFIVAPVFSLSVSLFIPSARTWVSRYIAAFI